MSLRRKSCESCFKGRRKCDRAYPACKRCQRNKKTCQYLCPPTKEPTNTFSPARGSNTSESDSVDLSLYSPGHLYGKENDDGLLDFNFDINDNSLLEVWLRPSIPSLLGPLGEIQPITGNTQSWTWVIEQIKSFPKAFAQHSETVFIHKKLYQDSFPPSIRAAFGISAAYQYINDANQSMLFRCIDAEVLGLLEPASNGSQGTILEDLAKLQAMVLYQIIRLFHGDLKQRIAAEQQETLFTTWGLRLLQRIDHELGDSKSSWETWILAESIRRTVLVAVMLYAVYSIFKHGLCSVFPTLSILPISTKPSAWNSKAAYLEQPDPNETVKYVIYTELWNASPSRKLEPFEKILLVACKGIEQIETFSLPDVD